MLIQCQNIKATHRNLSLVHLKLKDREQRLLRQEENNLLHLKNKSGKTKKLMADAMSFFQSVISAKIK